MAHESDSHPVLTYVRFVDTGHRLLVVDEFVTRSDGKPLSAADRRDVPRRRIDTWANLEVEGASIRARLDLPGPDLRRAAAYFGTLFGKAGKDHWVRQMMWAQLPGGPHQPPMPRRSGAEFAPETVDARLPLEHTGKAYPPEFWERLSEVYQRLVLITNAPNKVIAAANGVEHTTADRWVRRARVLGYLPSAQRGKAG